MQAPVRAVCHLPCFLLLLLLLLATCRGRGSSIHLQITGDPDPTTERCTPRQARLQARLFKDFADTAVAGGWSACPAQLWLDVYHRESPLPGAACASLPPPSLHGADDAEMRLCLLAGLSPSRNKTFVDIGCNKVAHACMHASLPPPLARCAATTNVHAAMYGLAALSPAQM